MLNAALSVAQSGLKASEVRLASSANNIANARTTTSRIDGENVNIPYQPTDINQRSLPGGSAQAELVARDPASVSIYDPDNIAANAEGITEYPNVNLGEELVNSNIASYSFKANAVVLETIKEMKGELLDIFA